MSIHQHILILAVFCGSVRLRGCFRRWRQPLLRGPEWFFNVPVQPDFYTGPGKKLLHRFWIRMLAPVAIEIPLAIAFIAVGNIVAFGVLVISMSVAVQINHSFSVARAERLARALSAHPDEQPVPSLVFSMKPRRLSDYTSFKLEGALALTSLTAVVWLLHFYFTAPAHPSLRMVFWTPAFYLYAQFGMLFAKRVIVAWRSPVPQAQAAEHIDAREQARRFYLKVCDWSRALTAVGTLFWPFLLSSSTAGFNRLMTTWFAATMALGVIGTVWVEIRRKQLVAVAMRVRPVKLPDFLHESDIARWPLCYQPSVPMLVVNGSRGWSLNMANSLALQGAAYLAGLAVLFALLVVRI